jgi:NAD(P)H-flavin reductase/hemoglobin-like flavoprotein
VDGVLNHEDAMSQEPTLIKESFARVEQVADKVAASFYARLFLESPDLRDMFPLMLDVQRARLLRAVVQVVQGLDSPMQLDQFLGQLGYDHRKFGVRPEHYAAFGRSLIAAIREHTEVGCWTPEIEAAWLNAFTAVSHRMVSAAEQAKDSPPSWYARVIRVERAARDIALLTLRPDQPYLFYPGQYLSLETPRRPRLWRTYSLANAPRPDGTLDLHVRAVPGGWVSGALVAHTKVGDVLRLGPPRGAMRVQPGTGPDLLLIAGGTGLAPFTAIIEGLAGWNRTRSVHLFFGARQPDELYQLSALMRLSGQYPWLTVIGAVSDDPGYLGRRGLISDVAAQYGQWAQHQVYVSGSPPMIRATVTALRTQQVPLTRIRYDPFDD